MQENICSLAKSGWQWALTIHKNSTFRERIRLFKVYSLFTKKYWFVHICANSGAHARQGDGAPIMNKSILFCKYFMNKCKYFMNKYKYFMNKCKYFMNGLPQWIYEQIVNFIWTGKKSPRIFVQGDEWTFYYLVVK